MKKNVLLLMAAILLLPWCLNAQTFPELSNGSDEHWYSLFSHRPHKVLKDNGIAEKITSISFDSQNDELKWKFEATGKTDEEGNPTFKIVATSGLQLAYVGYTPNEENTGDYQYEDGKIIKLTEETEPIIGNGNYDKTDRIVAQEEGYEFIFKKYKQNDGLVFQLWCIFQNGVFDFGETEAKGSFVNMTNNTEDFQICLYGIDGDGGNPFSAITSLSSLDELYEGAPKLSTGDNPIWYQLQFRRGSKAITSSGIGENVLQYDLEMEDEEYRDIQRFRMEGSYINGFTVISKTGGMMTYNKEQDRIKLQEEGELFSFTDIGSKDLWLIKYLGNGNYLNETQGEVCLWGDINDAGSVLTFISADYDPYAEAPELSTEASPKWYYIKNCRSELVLGYGYAEEEDRDQIIQQDKVEEGDELDAQLFRFEGNYEAGFKIISKQGGTFTSATYEQGEGEDAKEVVRFELSTEAITDDFKFQPTSNIKYGVDKWGIEQLSSGNGVNAHDTKRYEVTTYGIGNDGSVWEFEPYSLTSVPKLEYDNMKAAVGVKGNNLSIKATGMTNVAIYNVAGVKVVSAIVKGEFEYTIPVSGYYIASLVYADGKTENVKFIIK